MQITTDKRQYVHIGEKYRLYRLDESNIVLEKFSFIKGKKKTDEGRYDWVGKGYFPRFSYLLKYVYNDHLKDGVEHGRELLSTIELFEKVLDRIDGLKVEIG